MAGPLGLHDTFTEEGYWWVEGREDKEVAGTLTFDPESRAVLKLLGLTREMGDSLGAMLSGAHRPVETIYGVTKKGKPVTLLHAFNAQTQLNMPGIPAETWKSNLLVIGLHLSNEEDDVFSKSYLRFDGIEKWLGHDVFTRKFDLKGRRITIAADQPTESHFADHADFKVTSVGCIYPNNERETHYSLDLISQMGIGPASPKSLNWHLSRAVRIQELASLCTGHHLPMLALELRGPEVQIEGGKPRPVEVHFYSALANDHAEPRPKHEAPLIAGPELITFNSGAVQSWFDQYEIFSPAIALFFTVTGQREMFTNIRLLLAIQALEVFHRRTTSEGVMADEEFATFYDALVKAIPDPGDKRMKQKLLGTCRYLNELSLGQRLTAIVTDLTASFGHTPPAFSKANIRKLVDTRNYFTHFSKELESRRMKSGSEMYWASRRIVLLLSLLFLQRLGVAASDLSRLLERHKEFARLWVTEGEPY